MYSVHESELTDLHYSSGIFQSSVSSSSHTSTLLGINRARAFLRDENEKAYAESLRIDMEKDTVVSTPKSSHTENITAANLTYIENSWESIPKDDDGLRLMNERLRRKTPLEPDISQGPCVISVRHTSFGLVRRLFDKESLMVDVYNWVGSLCQNPKYFELRDRPNKVVDSKKKVEACNDILFNVPS